MKASSDQWLQEFLHSSPLFEPLRIVGKSLDKHDDWPEIGFLNQLAAESSSDIKTKSGKQIRFVQQEKVISEFVQQYEPRIFLTGEIQTREHNWHDLFNALAWMTYPRSKAVLNQLHYCTLLQEKERNMTVRSSLRDAATLVDESGVIVVSSNDELISLLKSFEWKALFWARRAAVIAQMKFFLFGHGLYEKALRPYLGMTGKGICFHAEESFFKQSINKQIAMIDIWLDNFLSNGNFTSVDLLPVPLLGYPGWSPDNTDSSYYDNQSYFRQRRMKQASKLSDSLSMSSNDSS